MHSHLTWSLRPIVEFACSCLGGSGFSRLVTRRALHHWIERSCAGPRAAFRTHGESAAWRGRAESARSAGCRGDVVVATIRPVHQPRKIHLPAPGRMKEPGSRHARCKHQAADAETCFDRFLHFRANALISSAVSPVLVISMPVKSQKCWNILGVVCEQAAAGRKELHFPRASARCRKPCRHNGLVPVRRLGNNTSSSRPCVRATTKTRSASRRCTRTR